ncbi:PREDICTED: protein PHLOEM PROTEIN 2-LIKE A1-like [Prunus mume]|uniref:Protein PHLOEM PROTEIN 2-LIKE A1-like n=1 Tax=Prunus mume TaxID=102107 RepID=A0ABM1LLB8_PRUMU|nr:PREDICTED: protein PHLOEM PROTEIN 2-LIKE A1-like [Prunus mume]
MTNQTLDRRSVLKRWGGAVLKRQRPSEQPSNNKPGEKVTEAKPAPNPPQPSEQPSNNKPEEKPEPAPNPLRPSEQPSNNKPEEKQQLPENYEAIVRDADSLIGKSSVENLLEQLHAGITLNHKRKYWVDKKSNNCFMVYARDLSISWAEDDRNRLWPSLQETSGVVIDAAELINECWLEVHGKFKTTKLSPGPLYEVVFVVKLKASADGGDVPVNVSPTLPG